MRNLGKCAISQSSFRIISSFHQCGLGLFIAMSRIKLCVRRTLSIIADRKFSTRSIPMWEHQHSFRVISTCNYSPLICGHKFSTLQCQSQTSISSRQYDDKGACKSLKRHLSNRDTDGNDDDKDNEAEEEDSEDEIFDKYPHYEEDEVATSEPSHSIVHVSSARVDAVLTKAFGVGRAKIEEKLLEQKCLVNGKLLKKKSYQAKVGDYIDVVHEKTGSQYKVQRVRILDKLEGQTKSGNLKMVLRLWKKTFLVEAL